MSENDAQLELKKRARRRLVGAIALAMLAAIILPMVMDQAPKQPVQDIQIRIPAQDSGAFTSRILPVKPGATPTPLPPTAPAEAKPAREAAAKAKPEKIPDTRGEQKSAAAVAEAQPAASASRPPEVPPAAPANEKPPAKKPEEAKAKPAQATTTGEQWIVQLGAYRDQANVSNLTAKLKQQGYNFYTEVLASPDGVNKTRVRAGPFPSKESAESARERIKRIGVDGVVAQK